MSGPKCSEYTLTNEQRRILLEQQQRELEQRERELKLETERTNIKRYTNELQSLCAEISKSVDITREIIYRTGKSDDEYIKKIEKDVKQAQSVIRANPAVSSELTVLETNRKTLDSCLTNIKLELVHFNEAKAQVEQRMTEMEALVQQTVNRLNLLSANVLQDDDLNNEINAAIEKVKTIETAEFLKNYIAIAVTPLEKRCKQRLALYERDAEKYNSLLSRHLALCSVLGTEIKDIPFSADAIQILENEIVVLEKSLVQQAEETYIAESIDAVMAEMGYSLLGERSVTKSSGRKFRNELYAFNDGTAVNVTFASDGKITMELGGLDDTDRQPSKDESGRLCKDMETFCEDFANIERKLQERGVVSGERISILPPAPEYAQIINTNDYDMKKKVEKLAVKKKPRKGKTANKQQRIE